MSQDSSAEPSSLSLSPLCVCEGEMEREEKERLQVEVRAEGQQQLPMVRFVDGSEYGLPAGWAVEQRPRYSPKYFGKVDQFFYEPQTGRQFRSLKSAKKHVQELEQSKQTLETSEFGANCSKLSTGTQESLERNESTRKKKKKIPGLDLAKPPETVTWAVSDAESDKWSAYVGETMVPDEVKEDWFQAFASLNSGK